VKPRSLRAAAALALAAVIAAGATAARASGGAAHDPQPVLAYYYIWFDTRSWERAKTDYPLLGRYSSDDTRVLRRHVEWAQRAGIDGFIVSWKSTPVLNRRLSALVRIADELHFKLALIYQGLDFHRNPLPAARVAADLDVFARRYARDPAFHIYDKPLVIWSGTWKFTAQDVAAVTQPLRRDLLVLASEKNVAGFDRLAPSVDGDAYYWSSADPVRFPSYGQKLAAMSRAVHTRGGLWVAPAAAGFDARLIGGHQVVERRDGRTLWEEMGAAAASSPDAIGLISWNEFSENSHVEPSRRYGTRYLEVLQAIHRAALGGRSGGAEFDSSEPVSGIGYALPFFTGVGGVVLAGALVVVSRGSRRRGARTALPTAKESK
jgi:hypothetical protein